MINKNSKEPLISIVTPSFNRKQFVEKNILSIRKQTYKNFEHIVIDRNSTDGTVDILKKYADTYNMRWVSEPDEGMYYAINKGIKMSNGDIMGYLNTDDLHFPWTLKTVADTFLQNPDADIVYGDMLDINIITNIVTLLITPEYNFKKLSLYAYLSQPAVFIKKGVFGKIRTI